VKFFITITFCIFITNIYAQSFDDIISENKYIDCTDVSYNAASIIEESYRDNQIERIYDFLDYWESKCGEIEEINRIRTILDINQNKLIAQSLSEATIEDLMYYRSSLNPINENMIKSFRFDRDYYQSLASIDDLTQEMSRNSRSNTLDGNLILDFYADPNPSFDKIKTAPNSSKLKELHTNVYNKTYRMWEWHYALMTGATEHYGNISLFGIRPNFGIAFGVKNLRHNLDVVIDFRAGPSSEEFEFVYEGELLKDDTWTGTYFGLEYTYDFINTKKFDIGISPGLGYDRITVVNGEDDDEVDPKFLSSFNRNIGVVFKYKYGKRGGYLGLHLRYNWADYDNPGGTRLNGEYFNARLTIGNIFNSTKSFRLQNLE
jgi:hypothetical protein